MILLAQSKYYSVLHNTRERSFQVDFGQKKVSLSFCQLLALRTKINDIALDTFFFSETNPHGFSIVSLCNDEHLFVWNALEINDLKSLVQNTFAALGLSQRIVPIAI